MFVLGRTQNQLRQKGCQNLLQAGASESYGGHPNVTVVLHAKGSVHVLQILSMSLNALQSTLSCMLLVLLESWPGKKKCSFEDNEIPLVRTSYLSMCVDMEGAPSPWCLTTGTPRQGMYSRSPPEGSELNDAVQLSVALHHVLAFPANRISKAYLSIWHAGS